MADRSDSAARRTSAGPPKPLNQTEPCVSAARPSKIDNQIRNARLPTGGEVPFVPWLDQNRRGDDIIRKGTASSQRGEYDTQYAL